MKFDASKTEIAIFCVIAIVMIIALVLTFVGGGKSEKTLYISGMSIMGFVFAIGIAYYIYKAYIKR